VKVVIFCGGQGIRLREYSEAVPKPMVPIGLRPVLWHNMRYYAHFGHRDFILALGYKAEVIKEYFLHYNEAISNDFVLADGGRSLELLHSDIHDWRITFAYTGLHASIAERLVATRSFLGDDEMFLANYGDNLTDAPLNEIVEDFRGRSEVAALLSVRPTYTFHVVGSDGNGVVDLIRDVHDSGMRINGGLFLFRREIFDYIQPGEELVDQPFQRLIAARQLVAYRHDGFWAPMDTLKDKQMLEELEVTGRPPWAVWLREPTGE
jgi:glucose-1-phosphate cytidylyltransferase